MVLVKERQPYIIGEARFGFMSGEVMALCPVCKAFQTLLFTGGKLTPTRKFNQYGTMSTMIAARKNRAVCTALTEGIFKGK